MEKFCIDCKHHKDLFGKNCCDYFIEKSNYVTGEISFKDCSLVRADETSCGKEGRLFEKKLSFFEKAKGMFK